MSVCSDGLSEIFVRVLVEQAHLKYEVFWLSEWVLEVITVVWP